MKNAAPALEINLLKSNSLAPVVKKTEFVLRRAKQEAAEDGVSDAVIKRETALKRPAAPRGKQAASKAKPTQPNVDPEAAGKVVRARKPRAKADGAGKQSPAPVAGFAGHELPVDQDQQQLEVFDSQPLDEHIPKFFIARKKSDKKFHKANSLVHHHPKQVMTPVQQKLTNVLLRNAQNTDPVRELTWEIPVSDVLRVMKIESRNYEYIEKVILQMMNIKVKWDVLEREGISKNHSVVFPYTKFLNGVVTYEIHKYAAALLSNLDSYTSLDLDEEMALSKSCSIPIYENASRYMGIGHSRWFLWEEFRDLVLTSTEVPKNAQTWGSFNERYLGPSLKDVNSKTRLIVQLETEKVGRNVKYVRLLVQRAKSALNNSALNIESASKGVLVDSMRLLEVPDRTISKALRDHSEEQIKLAIAHVKWRRSATHLKPIYKLSKYFTDSLKHRWYEDSPVGNGIGLSGELFPSMGDAEAAPGDAQADMPSGKKKASAKTDKDVGMEKMIQAVKAQRLVDVKLILGELNSKETEELYAEYNATLQTESLHIKKSGRNKAGVLSSFHHWFAVKNYGSEITPQEILDHMARKIGSNSTPL